MGNSLAGCQAAIWASPPEPPLLGAPRQCRSRCPRAGVYFDTHHLHNICSEGDGEFDGEYKAVNVLPVPQGWLEGAKRYNDSMDGVDDVLQVISGHVLISSLVCIGPVYAMVHMLLSQPGQSIYFWIRG